MGINRGRLARRCGLTHQFIERFESGFFTEDPPSDALFMIAQELHTTVEALYGSPIEETTRVVLMNSAMMPVDGLYRRSKIGRSEFVSRIREAHQKNVLNSYIGHMDVAMHIHKITGVSVPVNRVNSKISTLDHVLVCTLVKRTQDPAVEERYTDKDYQYASVNFYGNKGRVIR